MGYGKPSLDWGAQIPVVSWWQLAAQGDQFFHTATETNAPFIHNQYLPTQDLNVFFEMSTDENDGRRRERVERQPQGVALVGIEPGSWFVENQQFRTVIDPSTMLNALARLFSEMHQLHPDLEAAGVPIPVEAIAGIERFHKSVGKLLNSIEVS